MFRSTRLVLAMALAVGAVGISAPAALAAPPGNDTFGGATAATLGFSEVIDTTEATTDADDTQLNSSCGAPATDASVWYAFTGSDTGVVVDVSQSDYSAGVLVGVGSQGNLQLEACGPGAVGFFASAGTTYYVLAIDDQFDGGGNGGSLNISFNEAPPPPTVELTVNRIGKFNSRTGVATISGTYTCENADFIEVFVDARQKVGRFTVVGFGDFFDFGTCDGESHAWSTDVFPDNGKFAGGKTMTLAFSFACGPFECAEGFVEQTVQLRGR
ncbi:MAG TPA: hypothetical protein VGZ50_05155 [Actinomycetota bacterium]|nr:hypothetical protein [Actinomycetota bacterium]